MSKTLEGKVSLVTGGSRGIGAATAERLARDGATVAIGYSASPEKAAEVVQKLEAHGVRAAAFQADQADPKAVAGLIEAVVKKFGRLDILVNNAGVFRMGAIGDPDADLAALDREQPSNSLMGRSGRGGASVRRRSRGGPTSDRSRARCRRRHQALKVGLPGLGALVAASVSPDMTDFGPAGEEDAARIGPVLAAGAEHLRRAAEFAHDRDEKIVGMSAFSPTGHERRHAGVEGG